MAGTGRLAHGLGGHGIAVAMALVVLGLLIANRED